MARVRIRKGFIPKLFQSCAHTCMWVEAERGSGQHHMKPNFGSQKWAKVFVRSLKTDIIIIGLLAIRKVFDLRSWFQTFEWPNLFRRLVFRVAANYCLSGLMILKLITKLIFIYFSFTKEMKNRRMKESSVRCLHNLIFPVLPFLLSDELLMSFTHDTTENHLLGPLGDTSNRHQPSHPKSLFLLHITLGYGGERLTDRAECTFAGAERSLWYN